VAPATSAMSYSLHAGSVHPKGAVTKDRGVSMFLGLPLAEGAEGTKD
jgi:hypothetical protein